MRIIIKNNLTMCNAYQLQNENFLDHIDVVCPKCAKHAVVSGGIPHIYEVSENHDIRCACAHCGFAARSNAVAKSALFTNSREVDVKSHVLYFNAPCDPFFHFMVWYDIPTTHAFIWAYNMEHLKVIERFIADKIRSRNGLENKNKSIASRLPTWASSAKNREYLLKTINNFKEK